MAPMAFLTTRVWSLAPLVLEALAGQVAMAALEGLEVWELR